MARIVFPGGTLLVPAISPYEWELVFEHVELAAKVYGSVRLELEREEVLVTGHAADSAPVCVACRRRRGGLTYTIGPRTLCALCGKKEARRPRADDQVIPGTPQRVGPRGLPTHESRPAHAFFRPRPR